MFACAINLRRLGVEVARHSWPVFPRHRNVRGRRSASPLGATRRHARVSVRAGSSCTPPAGTPKGEAERAHTHSTTTRSLPLLTGKQAGRTRQDVYARISFWTRLLPCSPTLQRARKTRIWAAALFFGCSLYPPNSLPFYIHSFFWTRTVARTVGRLLLVTPERSEHHERERGHRDNTLRPVVLSGGFDELCRDNTTPGAAHSSLDMRACTPRPLGA